MNNTVLIAAVLSLLLCLFITVILTPLTIKFCWKYSILDRPDGRLKNHKKATATLGGIPFFLAIVLTAIIMTRTPLLNSWAEITGKGNILALGNFALAALIMLCVGIYDDVWKITPRTKLFFQLVAAVILIRDGIIIESIVGFGQQNIEMGIVAIPFTIFWIVGSCNAFNFIDGMDGLASGIGAIISLTLGIMGLMYGVYPETIIAFIVAGGLMSFLLFNYNPAKIFLGDSGSMLIGMMLAVLAIRIVAVGNAFNLPLACLIMSLPVTDTLLSVLRRYSYADSPANGDRNHMHHCLTRMGLSVRQAVHSLWLAVAVGAGLALALSFVNPWLAAGIAVIFASLQIYMGIYIGCVNLQAMGNRIASVLHLPVKTNESLAQKYMSELERLWEQMKPLFEETPLDRATLTLEDISVDGKLCSKTYQWVRSEEIIANLIADRWTRQFSFKEEDHKKAVLQIESNKQLSRDEQRIEWLLRQIRNSFENNKQKDRHNQKIEEIFVGATAGQEQDFLE